MVILLMTAGRHAQTHCNVHLCAGRVGHGLDVGWKLCLIACCSLAYPMSPPTACLLVVRPVKAAWRVAIVTYRMMEA